MVVRVFLRRRKPVVEGLVVKFLTKEARGTAEGEPDKMDAGSRLRAPSPHDLPTESTALPEPKTPERPTDKPLQKRRLPSPPRPANGHHGGSPEGSPGPSRRKRKPGGSVHSPSAREQSAVTRGPFYQPAAETGTSGISGGLVGTAGPQDSRNDFYCWICHREGQVLCCELCPRVYHARCLKLPAEPEGDWFCPECEKVTVAECTETQSKAMSILSTEQLSFLLKFALQRMKHTGTDPFQKPVSLEQHPDYTEYIFQPMDLSTLEKIIKRKQFGCTEAFLSDAKWILHNCIIYNGSNHKLTATARMIIKICEHEMNEIEICPECYLASCQKRDNWFCEPCSSPHPLVWAKLKGFPFWPAKALREKDGQVDVRFFGQHDRAWVPIGSCYLMSKEIPFSVKKAKSIFNNAMAEMDVYVENIRRRFGVFNYAPYRTAYLPDSNYQIAQRTENSQELEITTEPDPASAVRFRRPVLDLTHSPKVVLNRLGLKVKKSYHHGDISSFPGASQRTSVGARMETDGSKIPKGALSGQANSSRTSSISRTTASKAQDGTVSSAPGSILNLKLDRNKAEMDLAALSETVRQATVATPPPNPSPRRSLRNSFFFNLDKTIENCKASLGIDRLSETGEEWEESENSSESEAESRDDGLRDADNTTATTDTNCTSSGDMKQAVKGVKQDHLTRGKDTIQNNRKVVEAKGESSKLDIKEEKNEEKMRRGGEVKEARLGSATAVGLGKKRASDGESQASEKTKEDTSCMEPIQNGQSIIDEDEKKSREALHEQTTSPPPSLDLDLDVDSDNELVIDLGDEGEKASPRREFSTAKSPKQVRTPDPSPRKKEFPQAKAGLKFAEPATPTTQLSISAGGTLGDLTDSHGLTKSKESAAPCDPLPNALLPTPTILGFLKKQKLLLFKEDSTMLTKPKDNFAECEQPETPKARPSKLTATSRPFGDVTDSHGATEGKESADSADTLQSTLLPCPAVPVAVGLVRKQRLLLPKDDSTKMIRSKNNLMREANMMRIKDDQADWNSHAQSQMTSWKWKGKQRDRQQWQQKQDQQRQQRQQQRQHGGGSGAGMRYATRQATRAKHENNKQTTQIPKLAAITTGKVTLVTTVPTPTAGSTVKPQSTAPTVIGGSMNSDSILGSNSAEVAADIAKYTHKIMDLIKGTVTEMFQDLSGGSSGSMLAEIRKLRMEIEKLQWLHQQEMAEMKHNAELTMAEMRQSCERERERLISEVHRQLDGERMTAVEEAKRKQWCAYCRGEAIFYCCWNTSYCDYPCQQAHWPEHMKTCTQSATAHTDVETAATGEVAESETTIEESKEQQDTEQTEEQLMPEAVKLPKTSTTRSHSKPPLHAPTPKLHSFL
uniref:MYND-type zinc finger-containing chromatin reader ZMYND8-like isoform X4 n=1 Tax=Myxine glutinosa TaxID=7769 RepID=UPI00358E964A